MAFKDVDIDRLELEVTGLMKDRIKWQNRGDTTMSTFREFMTVKYNYLATKSEGIFDMAIMGKYNDPKQEAKLYHMFGLMRKVQNGKMTEKAAEGQFGKENFDEYVQPVIDNLGDDVPASCNLTEDQVSSKPKK